jgi:hypothetical protein
VRINRSKVKRRVRGGGSIPGVSFGESEEDGCAAETSRSLQKSNS